MTQTTRIDVRNGVQDRECIPHAQLSCLMRELSFLGKLGLLYESTQSILGILAQGVYSCCTSWCD
jgi:hypothetical protein